MLRHAGKLHQNNNNKAEYFMTKSTFYWNRCTLICQTFSSCMLLPVCFYKKFLCNYCVWFCSQQKSRHHRHHYRNVSLQSRVETPTLNHLNWSFMHGCIPIILQWSIVAEMCSDMVLFFIFVFCTWFAYCKL